MCEGANAETGFYALDNAAITVKSPSHSPLISITRVAGRLIAVGGHGLIIYSDDSGQNWVQARVPVSVTLTAVYFADTRHGWAVGHYGAILMTTDGGAIWTRSATGLDVIAQLNEQAQQTLVDTPQTSADALKQKVAAVYQGDGPSKPFLAVGRCGQGVIAVGHQDMAMFSNDNGKTWQEWTAQFDAVSGFHDIYKVLSEGDSTFLIGENGYLIRSTEGCRNFVAVAGPYNATLFGGLLLKQGGLMVFGLDGGAYYSPDNGNTWQTLAAPDDAVLVAGATLPSGRVLLGTIRGAMLLSDSQFQELQPLTFSEPFSIDDMVVAPNGTMVVVGNGGVSIVDPRVIR
jgi:photosystem II stability/assembly factor-like uncharacterized protein